MVCLYILVITNGIILISSLVFSENIDTIIKTLTLEVNIIPLDNVQDACLAQEYKPCYCPLHYSHYSEHPEVNT